MEGDEYMITVTVEKKYGQVTVNEAVTAPSIEKAVERFGPGAKVVFPIDGEAFFAKRGLVDSPAQDYSGCRPVEAVAS